LQTALLQARADLARVQGERSRAYSAQTSVAASLSYYSKINDELTDATSGLTRLSNDGQLLRALSSLVALMRVQERESREHAVLSHRFATGEFAPGMYRQLVALMTEKDVYSASLQNFATSEQVTSYQRVLQQPPARQADLLLGLALDATEDGLTVDPSTWFSAQAEKVKAVSLISDEFARNVQQIAATKLAESRRAVRYGEALGDPGLADPGRDYRRWHHAECHATRQRDPQSSEPARFLAPSTEDDLGRGGDSDRSVQ